MLVPSATASLASRFCAGDETALRECFDRWGGLVLGIATSALPTRADAEDVVQETFVTAWHRRTRFDPEQGTLPGWIAGIARNRTRDRLRTLGRTALAVEPTESLLGDSPAGATGATGTRGATAGMAGMAGMGATDAESELDRITDRLVLRSALGELPDAQRQVLELAFYGHLRHREIAERLDLPLGTVKSHARRGLQTLRRALGDPHG